MTTKNARIIDVMLKNYKSIGQCAVELSPITILVGQNGSGKSNFLNALRLLPDALSSTLEYAIRQRGGINEVRRRSGGHPTHFGMRFRVELPDGKEAGYAFRVGAVPDGGFVVQQEYAQIKSNGNIEAFYDVRNGSLARKSDNLPDVSAIFPDRLFLTTVSALKDFRPLFDALSRMYFYNINPAEVRTPQPHDTGEVLFATGKNLPSVVRRLINDDAVAFERIQEYLRKVTEGIQGVDHLSLGPTETLEFRQSIQSIKHPWKFYAAAMSDGTLRSLGILTALFQTDAQHRPPTLVGVEEPESTIHPGAAAVLMDALIEASQRHQIVVTTHSPELLDHGDLPSENILVVENIEGETKINRMDNVTRKILQERLYTAGDLLRKKQISRKNSDGELRSRDLFRF